MEMVNSFDQDIRADGLICLQKELENMPKIINELGRELAEARRVIEELRAEREHYEERLKEYEEA